MRTIRRREIFTKKCRQQQNFDSYPKEAWHYNHVTFTPIAKNVMLYCRLIYMLSMLYVRLTVKVKMGIPESFKVGWYPHKIARSSHLKYQNSKNLSPNMVKWKRERRYISKLLIKTSEGNGYKHFKKVTLRIQELQVAYRFVISTGRGDWVK